MSHLLPLGVAAVVLAVALFTMVWAGLHWTWTATLLGSLIGVWGGWHLWRFGLRQQAQPGGAALERLTMKLAWRRGGWLVPADLGALGVSGPRAHQLLERLTQQGLCQPEGEGYRFYPGR